MTNHKRRSIPVETLRQSGLIEFYSKLIELEFSKRSSNDTYALAFSRLLKPDCPKALFPEMYRRAPEMIGTDERDLFIPIVKEQLQEFRRPLSILDIGSGDGQTFRRFAESVPDGSKVTIIEPNETYVSQFEEMIAQEDGRITLEFAICKPFLDCVSDISSTSFDLVLSLHSIYFLGPLGGLFSELRRISARSGRSVIVCADELHGYTGKVVEAHLNKHDHREASCRIARLSERNQILQGDRSESLLSDVGFGLLQSERQESRLYGHDFGDIIALGFITDLPFVVGPPLVSKIDSVLSVLLSNDPQIDLSLERTGLRARMLSVREPQLVTVLERTV